MTEQKTLLDDFFKNFEDKSEQGKIERVKSLIHYLTREKYYDKNRELIDNVVSEINPETIPAFFNNLQFLKNAIEQRYKLEISTIKLTNYMVKIMIKSLVPNLYPEIIIMD